MTTAYPDLDLEPFLADSTPFFQTYVRQALYNVGLRRGAQKKADQAGSGGANGVREKVSHLLPPGGERDLSTCLQD